jgi:23S rRNA (uracil1939-C5)-methyltransferase
VSCKRTARRPAPRLRLTLDGLAFGGDAVGRDGDGRVIFAEGGAPGDRVEVELLEQKKGYARGRVLRVLGPGAARVDPPCPRFLAGCGGCQWQHVDLAVQRAAKADIARRALRATGVAPDELRTPAPPYGWRRRARLRWREGVVGYTVHRSHELVDVDRCPQLEPALEAALVAVRGLPLAGAGEVQLLLGGRGDVHVVLGGARARELADAAAPLVGQGGIAGIVAGDVTLGAARIDLADDADVPFWSRADVFAQATAGGNALLRALVREAVPEGARVLELHAGSGNFTRDLARRAARVVAIEESSAALALAADNLAARGLAATLIARPAAVVGGPFDIVVVDPPRAGLDATLAAELAPLPVPIVYISCDPATLGRDIGLMRRQVVGAVPIDLMPQTFHIEVCALLAPP